MAGAPLPSPRAHGRSGQRRLESRAHEVPPTSPSCRLRRQHPRRHRGRAAAATPTRGGCLRCGNGHCKRRAGQLSRARLRGARRLRQPASVSRLARPRPVTVRVSRGRLAALLDRLRPGGERARLPAARTPAHARLAPPHAGRSCCPARRRHRRAAQFLPRERSELAAGARSVECRSRLQHARRPVRCAARARLRRVDRTAQRALAQSPRPRRARRARRRPARRLAADPGLAGDAAVW